VRTVLFKTNSSIQKLEDILKEKELIIEDLKRSLERTQRENELLEKEQREKQLREKEQRENEQREKQQREKQQREKEESEKALREKAQREKAQREKAQREKAQREKEQREKEQREKEQREKEQREKGQREKEKREKELREKEQSEKEQREKEKREQGATTNVPLESITRVIDDNIHVKIKLRSTDPKIRTTNLLKNDTIIELLTALEKYFHLTKKNIKTWQPWEPDNSLSFYSDKPKEDFPYCKELIVEGNSYKVTFIPLNI